MLYTKMLQKTEETIRFVIIIFVIGGISIGVVPPSPLATAMVLNKLKHSNASQTVVATGQIFVIFVKEIAFLRHFNHILHVFESI